MNRNESFQPIASTACMKYVLAMFICLTALSSSSGALESKPKSPSEESPSHVCSGIAVCVNHVLWCEPRTPNGGKPVAIGRC